MFNSFGNIFRLTSFGESHGKGIGGVIDGFPAGIVIDEEFVQQELSRRRPGTKTNILMTTITWRKYTVRHTPTTHTP